ncbi:SRR1-like protein isoform X2 [Heliangelus exortis]|uniref:SRR1-like protein isoform X2 n=1 Tax=Heliangelus exortis TaxID=472823 RepID=UPI003A94CC77
MGSGSGLRDRPAPLPGGAAAAPGTPRATAAPAWRRGRDGARREGGGGDGRDGGWRRRRKAPRCCEGCGRPGAVRAPLSASTEPPTHCVCYGLGRFSCCPSARYQLGFLLLLLEELGEVGVLGKLGLRMLQDNEEGKHSVEGSGTLFYMVHCGKALYNNLLWRNWALGTLSKMVIVGNSFKGIEERLLSRILERDYSYIAKILKGTEEVALPAHPRYLDTFSDTSIHWFPLQKLKELSPEVWDFVEEPMYPECEDLEIIRKQDGHSPAALTTSHSSFSSAEMEPEGHCALPKTGST